MLVFIDESGDPGLKLGSGSTDYFIVTLVVFEDNDEATATDQRIDLLKRELGFPAGFEFHFNKVKGTIREAFLSAVASFEFFYFSIVINKAKLNGPGFKFKDALGSGFQGDGFRHRLRRWCGIAGRRRTRFSLAATR